MVGRLDSHEDRAVSEAVGVLILVGFTVLVLASVGVGVLFVDTEEDGGPPTVTFAFEHFSENSILQVRHESGDPIPAGQLVLEGEPGAITWAEIAKTNETDLVEPGDPIQLSQASAWGDHVTSNERVEIYYVPDPDNRTLLDHWRGS